MAVKRTLIAVLALGLSLFVRPSATGAPPWAQAPGDWPALFLMEDFLVDVSRAAEYETALKDLVTELKRYGFPFRFDTYATDDGHYYLIYALEGFADVDRWLGAWRKTSQAMGQATFQALRARLFGPMIESAYRFWRFRTDLSFLPSKERLKPEEIGHYTWDFVWVIPGKEAEFEALNREWAALCAAQRARDPFLTYAAELGTNGPAYAWFEYGKSPADYAAAEEGFWNLLGDAGADLAKRTRALIRRMESKTGRYRPDLSFAPGR
jgi:hypothetical protein